MQPIDRTIMLKTKNTSVISSNVNRKKYLVVTFKVSLMFNYPSPFIPSRKKPLSTSKHGLKTVNNIYRKHDHKIANTLTKKAKLTQKLQTNSQMEQEQSILGFLKWLHYFHHQYKTKTFLQARTTFFRRTRETNNSSHQCISAKPRDDFTWTGTICNFATRSRNVP